MPLRMGRTFQSKSWGGASSSKTAVAYRSAVQKHPFLLFGLPFISIMVAGSFFLTPATALRYERHDKKVRQMSKEEALSLGTNKRKVDPKEEYYVCVSLLEHMPYFMDRLLIVGVETRRKGY
jgi:cytochrome c oxidase assembly protein subunit 16